MTHKEQLMSEIIAKYDEKVTALEGIIHTQVTYGTVGTVMKFRKQVDLCDESIASIKSQLAEAEEERKLTDEDIEIWARGDCNAIESYVYRLVIDAKIFGAKSMRDGLIKHIDK